MLKAEDRLIVAIDVPTEQQARELIEQLSPRVKRFKIGLELITNIGRAAAVACAEDYGAEVFYDGKLDDIPNTVKGAAKAIVGTPGVTMFNIHASAGIDAMLAVVEVAHGLPKPIQVLAVSVLTSLDEHNAHLIFGAPVKAKVLQLARDAKLAGCDGMICSPEELEVLVPRKELRGMFYACPGIRPEWYPQQDQRRTLTPGAAIRAGVTYPIVGRPILQPKGMTMLEAADRIIEEIDHELTLMN